MTAQVHSWSQSGGRAYPGCSCLRDQAGARSPDPVSAPVDSSLPLSSSSKSRKDRMTQLKS